MVLKFSEAAAQEVLLGLAGLLVVGYLPRVAVGGVVRKADVEETRVLLGNELMHIVSGRAHI